MMAFFRIVFSQPEMGAKNQSETIVRAASETSEKGVKAWPSVKGQFANVNCTPPTTNAGKRWALVSVAFSCVP